MVVVAHSLLGVYAFLGWYFAALAMALSHSSNGRQIGPW